jgi:hypothetical protein
MNGDSHTIRLFREITGKSGAEAQEPALALWLLALLAEQVATATAHNYEERNYRVEAQIWRDRATVNASKARWHHTYLAMSFHPEALAELAEAALNEFTLARTNAPRDVIVEFLQEHASSSTTDQAS